VVQEQQPELLLLLLVWQLVQQLPMLQLLGRVQCTVVGVAAAVTAAVL
jgi:hypothetical protein